MRPIAGFFLLFVPTVLLAGDNPISPLPPRPGTAPEPLNLSPLPPQPTVTIPLPPVPEAPNAMPDLTVLRQEAERLRAEREALATERQKVVMETPPESEEIVRLRRRLSDLVAVLSSRPVQRRSTTTESVLFPPSYSSQPRPTPTNATAASTPEIQPGDPLLVARSLFRAGDYGATLETYRQIDQNGLTPDERVLVQYMSACCLRKLGRLDEAAVLYREVANAHEDEVLTDCALWHLSAINWRRDMEKELEDLRQRRLAR